ncbi:MAG: histidine kinase N-terminal 7TM domain-containing protein [Oscillospiraceae bacterium]
MILVFTIIAAAYSCRILAMLDIGGVWMNYIRAALYLLLFSLWGYSIDRRIIQKQALHCLRLTAALMLVWLILRTLKYEFVTDLTVARYIWYLYYLPMLFIPLLGVYIALTLGKSEEYRLTERAGFLVAVPGILFLLVITNDLHQQVFAFNSGVPGVPDNYGYSHGIFLLLQHGLDGCVHDFFPCPPFEEKPRPQRQQKKRIRPFVIACITVLYGLLYLSGLPAIRRWLGDMNVTFCLLYAAIYESCIRCRMIPSNTGYVELFEATTLAACIADRSGSIVLRSRAAGGGYGLPEGGRSAHPAQRNTHLLGAHQRRLCRMAG